MDDNNNIKKAPNIPPFLRYCSAIIPTAFDDSLSYYEALCALYKWLQDNIVDVINNNAKVTQYYIDLVKELKSYVENYFANLDVQEEINNKLDAMAEDGTLQEIIEAYITSEVRYYFPKFMENAYSQDFSIIVHDYNGDKKYIMVDAGHTNQWTDVLEMITTSGCDHIDYFILTHYDIDHYGCLENLINTHYIDSNTVVYLPAQVTNYPGDITTRMASVNNLLTINNIPTETHEDGDIEEIGTLSLKFGNVSKATVEAHTTKSANAMSQIVLFEHKGVKALYNGDATREVQEMLYRTKFCDSNVDLFKADHHIIDQFCNENFIYSIAPTYAVQTSAIKDFVKNNYGVSEEGTILKKLGTKIISCVMQNKLVEFVSKEGVLQCKTGRPLGFANNNIDYDLYVDTDASQSKIQDGTQEHPFTEVMQAIGSIQNDFCGTVTIHVADGYYGKPHELEAKKNSIVLATGKNVRIAIVGESKAGTILNHIYAYSSTFSLKDLTVDVDNNDAIRLEYNSKLELNNVDIKSATDTLSTTHSAFLVREGSSIQTLGDVYVTDCNQVLVARNSDIYFGSYLHIGTNNSPSPLSISRCSIVIDSITFDNAEDEESFTRYYRLIPSENSILAPNQDTFTTSYTLTKSANLFDYVDIYYTTNDSIRGHKRINMLGSTSVSCEILEGHLGSNNIRYDKCCKVTVSGKDVTLSNMRQYTFNPANNVFICTEATNYFKIHRVMGGFF